MLKSINIYYIFYINNQKLFEESCKYGKLYIIKILKPKIDPVANNNFAIRSARWCGHLDVVK